MKLLFVHQNLGALGGAETNIHFTAAELQRRGHVLGLLYSRRTGRNEDQWRLTFSETFPLPQHHARPAVSSALERFAPDLIYLHNLADLDVLETLLHSRMPVVRLVHDHTMCCMRSYKYNYFTRKVCTRPASWRCILPCLASVGRNPGGTLPLQWVSYAAKQREIRLNQQFRRLLVFSRFMEQELLRNGFEPAKIEVLAPTLDWGPRPLPSSLSDRNLVLYAGQIIRGKGVDLLLRALARVQAPFEAFILGDGNHRRFCERLCTRLGLQQKVRFQGFLPPHQSAEFYRVASVFVFPSVWPEPFGLAGLEALRCGIPVVAFNTGAVREWLADGESGFLVPWMDVGLFAARIEELLLNKPLAHRLGSQGRERVARQYHPGSQMDCLESLFFRTVHEAQIPAPERPLEFPVSAVTDSAYD